jgi:hypothetical protein
MTSQPGGVVPTGPQQNGGPNSAAGGGPVRRDQFPDPAPVHESRFYALPAAGQQQQQLGEPEGRVRHPLDGELGDPAPVHEGGVRHQSMSDQQKRAHVQHEDFQVGRMDMFVNERNGKSRDSFFNYAIAKDGYKYTQYSTGRREAKAKEEGVRRQEK